MTEEEWLKCGSSRSMIEFVQSRVSERKLRLFACSCCRFRWSLVGHVLPCQILQVAEDYAEGRAPYSALQAVGREFSESSYRLDLDNERFHMLSGLTNRHVRAAVWCAQTPGTPKKAELIRDIFGNPFRPVTLDPRWLSSTVLDLARTIYDERLFERLPILADALMDAGCDSEEILNHCRSEGPHVRGCWVVDLVLGKE